MTATANAIKVGEIDGQDVLVGENTDTYTITVPAADKVKPEYADIAGQKQTHSYTFGQVTSDEEAEKVCKAKDWNLQSFVNEKLKDLAKAASYQSKLNEFKQPTFDEDKAKEDMVKTIMRLQKVDEATARSLVASLLG